MASPELTDASAADANDMTQRIAAFMREQREKNPAAFEQAAKFTAKVTGQSPEQVRALADNPPNLAELRPDIAAMQAMVPTPGPSSVDMQADAQAADPDSPAYFEYADRQFPLKHAPDALDLADLAEYLEMATTNPIPALAGISRCLRAWVADYEGWREAFRSHCAGMTVEKQMGEYGAVAVALFETTTARPTAAPADSSDGRGPTTTSSKDVSPSPVSSPSTAPPGSATSTRG